MKLRNRKTGEIGYLHSDSDNQVQVARNSGYNYRYYNSLAELNEEWEDYEEPKVGYIVEPMGEDCVSADDSGYEESDVERAKELGIWFKTEEEAAKAVDKLRAFKRLKDKGFKVDLWDYDGGNYKTGKILFRIKDYEENDKDLDICFGGEE